MPPGHGRGLEQRATFLIVVRRAVTNGAATTRPCRYFVGDTVTTFITPLSVGFPIIIAVVPSHRPSVALGTLISAMLPYLIAFGLAWTAMVAVWVAMGVPLGPGAPLVYPPPG